MHAQLSAHGLMRHYIHLPHPSRADLQQRDLATMKARFGRISARIALDACTRQQRRPLCLIIEDDTRLHPKFLSELAKTLDALPRDWQVLHLCPEFVWGSALPNPTPFKLHPDQQRPSDAVRFFSHWPATGGQWVGGPLAFVVRRPHAGAMARTLRGGTAWLFVTRQPDRSLSYVSSHRPCIGNNASVQHIGCRDEDVRCCEPEAVDQTLAIRHDGAYVARSPPLCIEDAGAAGGTSWGFDRFNAPQNAR